MLRRRWKAGMCFVDVGAHQGEFTVAAAAWVGPGGSVLSFEPVSRLQRELLCNVEINGFRNAAATRESRSSASVASTKSYANSARFESTR